MMRGQSSQVYGELMSEDQTKLITIGQGQKRARAGRLLRRAGSLGLSALEARRLTCCLESRTPRAGSWTQST